MQFSGGFKNWNVVQKSAVENPTNAPPSFRIDATLLFPIKAHSQKKDEQNLSLVIQNIIINIIFLPEV